MRRINNQTWIEFRERVWRHFNEHGRKELPWRKTKNPYCILVSEIMLQQTQVDRVIPKYKAFLKRFPTISSLAEASLKEVLALWSGLGYNRRGKMLHETAKIIVDKHEGTVPKTTKELEKLPGVGPYTAAAVVVFAYNEPIVMIETNIRSVFIHEFFKNVTDVQDSEILRLIALSVDKTNPREWYAALMDYGAHLKRTVENPSRKSTYHVRQSPFEGSNRQVRGAIIKRLTRHRASEKQLLDGLGFKKKRIQNALVSLKKEGMIKKVRYFWIII